MYKGKMLGSRPQQLFQERWSFKEATWATETNHCGYLFINYIAK